jgi:molecular chaperone GrpE
VLRGQRLVLEQMLGAYDDVARALEAVEQRAGTLEPSENGQALREGVELVYRKLSKVLEQLGVRPIETVGKPFDEREHEAVMQQPAADMPAGTVVAEVQRGYRMGDHVLRYAQVVVAAE